MANGLSGAGVPLGPRCALRSNAAAAAWVMEGAWMKPGSLLRVTSGPASPAGSVVTAVTDEAGVGRSFSTHP